MSLPSTVSSGTPFQQDELFAVLGQVVFGSTAMLAYSQVTSFDREVEYVWGYLSRPAAWLFVLIRYPALLTQLIKTGLNSYTPGCSEISRLAYGMEAIALLAGYVFQILRTQAIWGSGWFLVSLLSVACFLAVVCEIWIASIAACDNSIPTALQINIQFPSELVFQSLVLAITIWRTRSLLVQQRILRSQQGTLALRVLKNEMTYYLVLMLCDTAELVANNFQTVNLAGAIMIVIFKELNYPLRWALLSHMILELQQQVLLPCMSQENSPHSFTLLGYPTHSVGRCDFRRAGWKNRRGQDQGVSSQNQILLEAVTSLNSPTVS